MLASVVVLACSEHMVNAGCLVDKIDDGRVYDNSMCMSAGSHLSLWVVAGLQHHAPTSLSPRDCVLSRKAREARLEK